jgi:hypothetical protein
MSIHWDSLLAVFAVSLGSTVAVVVLVTLALLGLSIRARRPAAAPVARRRPMISPAVGTTVAAVCLATAVLIVLCGLWVLIAG